MTPTDTYTARARRELLDADSRAFDQAVEQRALQHRAEDERAAVEAEIALRRGAAQFADRETHAPREREARTAVQHALNDLLASVSTLCDVAAQRDANLVQGGLRAIHQDAARLDATVAIRNGLAPIITGVLAVPGDTNALERQT